MPCIGVGIGPQYTLSNRVTTPYYEPLNGAYSTVAFNPLNCFSDATHVVNCNDGDAVRWIKDNNGNFHEQPTSGARPILRADGDRWYLEFDGTSTFFDITFASQTNYNFIYGCATQIEQNTSYGMALSLNNYREFSQNGASPLWHINSGNGTLILSGNNSLGINRVLVANVGAVSGNNTYFKEDNIVIGNAGEATGIDANITSVKLGRRNGTTSYTLNGRIYGYCILPATTEYVTTNVVYDWLHNTLPALPYLIDRYIADNATYTGALPAVVATLPGTRRTLTRSSGNVLVNSGGVNGHKYITFTSNFGENLSPTIPFNLAPPYTLYLVVRKRSNELFTIGNQSPNYVFHLLHVTPNMYSAVASGSFLLNGANVYSSVEDDTICVRISHTSSGAIYLKSQGLPERTINYTYAWQRKGFKFYGIGDQSGPNCRFYDLAIVAGDVRGSAYETNLMSQLYTLYGVGI